MFLGQSYNLEGKRKTLHVEGLLKLLLCVFLFELVDTTSRIYKFNKKFAKFAKKEESESVEE